MAVLIWTSMALDLLDEIADYIAQDSPDNAVRVVHRVFAAAERLREFPRSGRVVPEAEREDVREIIVGNYRVVYRLIEDRAEVLIVQHGARLLDTDQLEGK